VAATRDEQRTIQRFLGISWAWFRRRYRTLRNDGIESLRWDKTRCVFLDGERRCRIYPVRPAQCRTYPFWPEIVRNRNAWKREGRRCEGIGRGPVIRVDEWRRPTKEPS
jgi:Fe-S-cluster containining protein